MMDSLASILGQSDWQEPEVIAKIKAYVSDTFQASVNVGINRSSIIISAPSASLVNALRLHTTELKKIIGSEPNKRLIFRIDA
jgi:hypothetical protein